ncbi:hypothetical protein [Pseudomonas sp. UBA2684]|uniref:hypothetical protein n=1 Tax=Pseudomonas sp. UBA2684 TaxID=1947311 RepID=UPI0025DE7779|nr:hypothetical protein [Pseudomonas sp. UBA2684]|tara:strand:- start:7259 stop:7558 length:300 start_codon:yes stop_codon:yes gene_type:complete
MSTFMKRKALVGSAAMLSLLAALHAPVSLAGEGHSEHEQHAAETQAPKSAPDKNAAQAKEKAASQQMGHGDMNHNGMDHESMMDKHGGTKAEAGSNHDH